MKSGAFEIKRCICFFFLGTIAVIGVLAIWPCKMIASPKSRLRIVDEAGKSLIDVRVVRKWDTSEGQKAENQAMTDHDGEASFERVGFTISGLKWIIKPLLILLPASCGPGWEIYGHTEFDIYLPNGYKPKFNDARWKKEDAVYKNNDGINIYDPAQNMGKSYVGLYFFNKSADFEFTLTAGNQ